MERRSSPGRDTRSEARTQGAPIVRTIGATEDAASGRVARSGGTDDVSPIRPPGSGTALERAIEPVEREDFLERYWERAPLHVARGEQRRFDDLLSKRDVERLISSPALRYPAFRLVKADAQLAARDYTVDIPWRPEPFTGSLDVARVATEVAAGATVVLQGLHLNHEPVARFCRSLEQALGHPTQANSYSTPRASQGLPVHHDTHDVFVLQVDGSKRWLVYEPVLELPLKTQRYAPGLGEPGEVVLDVTLHAGDTLYLPRGWLHEAVTSETDSLHLTIGVNAYTWLDAFRAAVERLADDVDFRRSVPEDGAGAPDLVERLAQRLEPSDVASAMRDGFVRSRRPILGDLATQLRALGKLTLDTPLERRATVIAELADAHDAVALTFEGKQIRFPAHARAEVDALFGVEGPFTLRELPGRLDDAGRLVLARRLVREGFLCLSDQPSEGQSRRNGEPASG